MQRRKVIKQLVYITGSVFLLPACMQRRGKPPILFEKINIESDQEKILAALSETIIPVNSIPEAKEVSAHIFVLSMIDACYKKQDQQKFISGLKAFEAATKKKYNKTFVNCTPDEKETVVSELESANAGNTELSYFYLTFKFLLIKGYTTSEYYLTKVQVYELVPGHFYGCVPVKSAS